MNLLLKDPQSLLDYEMDWGADYLDGDYLAASRWEVSPEDVAGIFISADRFDALISSATIGGGTAGMVYRLTNHIVLQSGREDRRSIQLRVEPR